MSLVDLPSLLKHSQIPQDDLHLALPSYLSTQLCTEAKFYTEIQNDNSHIYSKFMHYNCELNLVNQDTYIGDMDKGYMHGVGEYQFRDGATYQGRFAYNLPHGKGRLSIPTSPIHPFPSIYEGDFHMNHRHGNGVLTLPSHSFEYSGEFNEGKMEGKAAISYKNNSSYSGEVKNGRRDGFGILKYPSGNWYEGEWKNGVKEGTGKMVWEDRAEVYQGLWSNNQCEGLGCIYYFHQNRRDQLLTNRYFGEFKKGVRHGFGTFYYADGSKYSGQWVGGFKEGYAEFTLEDGSCIEAIFEKDRMSILIDTLLNEKDSLLFNSMTNPEYLDDLADVGNDTIGSLGATHSKIYNSNQKGAIDEKPEEQLTNGSNDNPMQSTPNLNPQLVTSQVPEIDPLPSSPRNNVSNINPIAQSNATFGSPANPQTSGRTGNKPNQSNVVSVTDPKKPGDGSPKKLTGAARRMANSKVQVAPTVVPVLQMNPYLTLLNIDDLLVLTPLEDRGPITLQLIETLLRIHSPLRALYLSLPASVSPPPYHSSLPVGRVLKRRGLWAFLRKYRLEGPREGAVQLDRSMAQGKKNGYNMWEPIASVKAKVEKIKRKEAAAEAAKATTSKDATGLNTSKVIKRAEESFEAVERSVIEERERKEELAREWEIQNRSVSLDFDILEVFKDPQSYAEVKVVKCSILHLKRLFF
jgi:hypothetical protein